MLTDEDITAYESSIHEWITHNTTILKEWKTVGSAAIGVCGSIANIDGIDSLDADTLATQGDDLVSSLTQIKNSSTDDRTVRLASSCLDVIASGKLQ